MQDAQVLNRTDLSYMKLRPKQNLELRDFFSHTENRDYKTRIAGKKKTGLRETPMAAISLWFFGHPLDYNAKDHDSAKCDTSTGN